MSNTTRHFIFYRSHQSLWESQNYIRNFEMTTPENNTTCFFSLFILVGHSTLGPASIVSNDEHGDPFYSAGPHRNRCNLQPTQEILGRGYGKNAGEWTRRVEIIEEELPGSRRNMHGYRSASCFQGRIFELCFLNRRVFNFCVRSTPLRGGGGRI